MTVSAGLISIGNALGQRDVAPGLNNLKALSKLSSPMSERTFSSCDLICLYALSTTTRNLCRTLSLILTETMLAHLVNDIATRSVCQSVASLSLQSPLIEAEMDTAAESAPVKARWIPDEKNGSMKA